MRFFCIIFLTSFVAGCSQPASNSNAISERQQKQQSAVVAELATVGVVESSLTDSELPKTPQQIVDLFVAKYKTDPESAFVDLFDWKGMEQDVRRKKLNGLLTLAYSKTREAYPLNDNVTKLVDVETQCRDLGMSVAEFNEGREVPISHVLELEMQYPSQATAYTTLSIGQRNGIYYFYPDN